MKSLLKSCTVLATVLSFTSSALAQEPLQALGPGEGALSIVDLPTVRRLDLYTGGFTADFGDRHFDQAAIAKDTGGLGLKSDQPLDCL